LFVETFSFASNKRELEMWPEALPALSFAALMYTFLIVVALNSRYDSKASGTDTDFSERGNKSSTFIKENFIQTFWQFLSIQLLPPPPLSGCWEFQFINIFGAITSEMKQFEARTLSGTKAGSTRSFFISSKL
jgi:hypothetical protein